jgi:putative endonuclease
MCEGVFREVLTEWNGFMFYVYILESIKDGSKYIGETENLKRSFKEHNNGLARYTNSKKPFKLAWYCAFNNKKRAYDFEKYLKSSSGYAFTNKRLI